MRSSRLAIFFSLDHYKVLYDGLHFPNWFFRGFCIQHFGQVWHLQLHGKPTLRAYIQIIFNYRLSSVRECQGTNGRFRLCVKVHARSILLWTHTPPSKHFRLSTASKAHWWQVHPLHLQWHVALQHLPGPQLYLDWVTSHVLQVLNFWYHIFVTFVWSLWASVSEWNIVEQLVTFLEHSMKVQASCPTILGLLLGVRHLLLGVHQASSLTYPVAAYAGLCIIFILLLRIFQSFHILQSERVQSNSLCNLCKPCRLQSSGRTGTKTSCDNRSATALPSRLVLVPFLLHFCFLLLTHECKRDRGTKISLACSWMNTRHDSSTPTKSINSIKYKSYLHTMISFKAMSSSLFISGFPLRVQRIQYLGKAHAAIGWERVQSDSISAPRWTLIPIVLNC